MVNLPDAADHPRFLQSCPWYLLYYTESVAEVARLYGWRADGCLDPSTLDLLTRRCVEAYANGIARGQHDRHEADAKRRAHDAKAKQATAGR